MTEQQRVVAAIDFGTHGTGFAWATLSETNRDPARRRVIFFDQWEQQPIAAAKNRSAVLLDRSDNRFVAWGFRAVQLMDGAPRDTTLALQTGFKMGLQRDRLAAPAIGGDAGLTLAEGATDPYRLAVLVLREVFTLARAQIVRGPYVEHDIRWCVTVPAIWDQYTRDIMYRAAVEAGLPDDRRRLLLVPEPAAAALYCAAKGDTVLSTPGTRFLVVDAGGGTLDITSYQVGAGGGLTELALPSGARAGSEYLNKAFMEEILVGRLGADFVDRMVHKDRPAIAAMMDSWERAKWAFGPGTTDPLVIQLSGSLYRELLRDRMARGATEEELNALDTEIVIGRDEVARLFDTVVDRTIAVVDSRLAELRRVSGKRGGEVAVLVGGFAESPYLRARLGAHLGAHGARLLVPEQPSVAVLAGAVHYAYDRSALRNWRSPLTYGVTAAQDFRPGVDPEHLKLPDADGRLLCNRRFDAFVTSEESVDNGRTVSRVYVPVLADTSVMSLELLTCPRPGVQYVDDQDVTVVANLRLDLTSCMHLPRAKREVEVTMEFGQSQILAAARNVHTGQVQDTEIAWTPTW